MISQMKKHITPIPPNVKHPGLKIRCTFCDTYVTTTCLQNGKSLSACSNPSCLEYRSVIHLPNSKHGRRVKTHKTTNLNEAIVEHIKFRDGVKGAAAEEKIVEAIPEKKATTTTQEPAKPAEPRLLTEWAALFMSHMRDVDTPSHLKQNLSKEYLAELDREMKRLCVCLSKHVDIRSYPITSIDDTAVGIVCDYLIEEKNFSNRTFNKHINTYATFYAWWQKKTRYGGENFFSKVNRKDIFPDPQTFDNAEEFEAFLSKITPENGYRLYPGTQNDKRTVYRPWLKQAYQIALETGARRENLVLLKTSDVIEDETGPVVLRIENIKVNNIMHLVTEEEKRYIPVPITENLKKLIADVYEKYKTTGEDQYLVAPEVTEGRESAMLDIISRAFSHYYKQLNTGKELTFGSLRKAYTTQMEIFTGGRAETVTGHSNRKVLRHYVVPEIVARAARGFSVFPQIDDRHKELKEARKKSKSGKEKSKER